MQNPKYDTIRGYIGLVSEVSNKIFMKCDKVGKCPTYFPLEPHCRKVVYGPGENGPLRLACLRFPTPHIHLSPILQGLVDRSFVG